MINAPNKTIKLINKKSKIFLHMDIFHMRSHNNKKNFKIMYYWFVFDLYCVSSQAVWIMHFLVDIVKGHLSSFIFCLIYLTGWLSSIALLLFFNFFFLFFWILRGSIVLIFSDYKHFMFFEGPLQFILFEFTYHYQLFD